MSALPSGHVTQLCLHLYLRMGEVGGFFSTSVVLGQCSSITYLKINIVSLQSESGPLTAMDVACFLRGAYHKCLLELALSCSCTATLIFHRKAIGKIVAPTQRRRQTPIEYALSTDSWKAIGPMFCQEGVLVLDSQPGFAHSVHLVRKGHSHPRSDKYYVSAEATGSTAIWGRSP